MIGPLQNLYETTVYYFWNWKDISDFYSLLWVKEKKFGSILKEKFSISGVPTTLQVKLDRQRNLTLKSRPLVRPQLWSDKGAKYLVSVSTCSLKTRELSFAQPLLICTWSWKTQVEKTQVWQTRFLACKNQFWNWFLQAKNLVLRTWFFQLDFSKINYRSTGSLYLVRSNM